MTDQQIEKAAQQHADKQFPILLDTLSTNPWPDVKEFLAKAYKQGVQDALSHQWISVEDALPELGQRVLVYRKHGGVESAFIAKRVPLDSANPDELHWHWTQVVYDNEIKAWCAIPPFSPRTKTYVRKSEWIPVEEELPDKSEEVLCMMKSNGAVVSGFIFRNSKGKPEVATDVDFHFEDCGGYEPTHWMHKPLLNNKK